MLAGSSLLVDFVVFIVSLGVIIYGAEQITQGSAHVARALGVSEFIIGATVVAFGTSLPELTAGLAAILQGVPDIAISMVVGSNVANIALIGGLTAAVYRIKIHRDVLSTDVPFLIAATIGLVIVMLDGEIILVEGLVLLGMYGAFVSHSLRHPTKGIMETEEEEVKNIDPKKIVFLVLGIFLLFLGARYLIVSATSIMQALDLTGTFVGFLMIAFGTSLPELSTTFSAARRGLGDIAIGNVIGSNTFNALIVVGLGSIAGTMPVSQDLLFLAAGGMTLVTILLGFSLTKARVTRFEGMLYVLLYIIITISLLRPV